MFQYLALPLLPLIYTGAAVAVWIAGIHLSSATDILAGRFRLGEALGGLILLAIVTNLPEIAIVFSGALCHDLSLAVDNILGGIAVQIVVLVILDIWGVGKSAPLTYRAASLPLVLEGVLVVAVLGLGAGHSASQWTDFWTRHASRRVDYQIAGRWAVAHRQVAHRFAVARRRTGAGWPAKAAWSR